MEDNEDWVLVRAPSQKDLWNPTSPNVADNEPSRPLKVTFSGPAKYWTDAIPIGNGRLGAMVWGGVQNEVLQLNGKSINQS
jgi:alpha-L-fucosidase 2